MSLSAFNATVWRSLLALVCSAGAARAQEAFSLSGPLSVAEGGTVNWSVIRSGSTAGTLVVTVSNDRPAAVSVYSPLIFLAGQAAATLALDGRNGGADAVIGLAATGYDVAARSLTVENVDPQITFTNIPAQGTTGDPLTFGIRARDVAADGPLTNIVWDFDDGTPPAVGSNPPPHTYSAANVYRVSVTVNDPDGGFAGLISNVTVTEKTLSLSGATALVEGDTAEWTLIRNGPLAAHLTVALGNSDPAACAVPAGVTILAGADRASFMVSAKDGARTAAITASASDFIPASRNVNVANKQPGLDYASIPAGGSVGVPLLFAAHFSDVAADTPLNYQWNFGDGTLADGPTNTHVFMHGGHYLVTVIAADKDGGVKAAQQDIVVLSGSQLTIVVVTNGLPGLGYGSVALDPPNLAGNFPPGTVVTLTAVPAPGSYFYKWSGDIPEGGTPDPRYRNPLVIPMDEAKTVYVLFSVPYLQSDLGDCGDADKDGLPDQWEIRYGLDPESPFGNNGPAADPDGDGMSNQAEATADTNPIERDSFLGITGIQRAGAGDLRIDWKGGADAWQYLQYCGNLSATGDQWISIFTNPPPTAAATNVIRSGVTNRAIYFRIKAIRH
jgi:PKD repeat protein